MSTEDMDGLPRWPNKGTYSLKKNEVATVDSQQIPKGSYLLEKLLQTHFFSLRPLRTEAGWKAWKLPGGCGTVILLHENCKALSGSTS